MEEKCVPPMDTKSPVLTYEIIPNLSVSVAHSCLDALALLFVYIVMTKNVNKDQRSAKINETEDITLNENYTTARIQSNGKCTWFQMNC
jgi:hypothetical protein